MAKIKRSEIQTFIDVAGDESYELLGEGVVAGQISYNPNTLEETYVHEDNASFSVESYAPNMPVEMTAVQADLAFLYLDAMRKARAILADAETTIVNVWMYESGGPTAYPAEQQAVVISFENFGGPGGEAVKMNFTINYDGNPIPGTFNASTGAFTAT